VDHNPAEAEEGGGADQKQSGVEAGGGPPVEAGCCRTVVAYGSSGTTAAKQGDISIALEQRTILLRCNSEDGPILNPASEKAVESRSPPDFVLMCWLLRRRVQHWLIIAGEA